MDFLLPGVPILFSSLVVLEASDIVTGDQRSLYCHLQGVVGGCLVRLVYQHGGLVLSPTVSSGFLPIARGGSSSGAPELLVIKAQDPLLFDEVMAIGHLVRSVRSAFTRHVGVPDVLLTMPLKFSNVHR